MIRHYIATLSVILALFQISCLYQKTRLSTDELKWVKVYKAGDTLIFKSTSNTYDTSYIIKNEVTYPEYMPITVHDKYLPEEAVIRYKNDRLKYDSAGDDLIYITKSSPRNNTRLFIKYLYAGVVFPDMNGAEKYRRGNVYEFDTYHPKADSAEPKKLFWHEDRGIIRYITHADVVWERVR